jgi:hypothetical protein
VSRGCHEIWKRLGLTRRFHDDHTCHGRSNLSQSARHGENQVSFRDDKNRGHKKWQSAGDLPLCAELRQSAIEGLRCDRFLITDAYGRYLIRRRPSDESRRPWPSQLRCRRSIISTHVDQC